MHRCVEKVDFKADVYDSGLSGHHHQLTCKSNITELVGFIKYAIRPKTSWLNYLFLFQLHLANFVSDKKGSIHLRWGMVKKIFQSFILSHIHWVVLSITFVSCNNEVYACQIYFVTWLIWKSYIRSLDFIICSHINWFKISSNPFLFSTIISPILKYIIDTWAATLCQYIDDLNYTDSIW